MFKFIYKIILNILSISYIFIKSKKKSIPFTSVLLLKILDKMLKERKGKKKPAS